MSVTDERQRLRALPEPPGPPLPVGVQSLLFGRFRHVLLPALQRRYGDVFTLRIAPHRRRLVVLCRAEDIRAVFSGPNTTFHAGEGNAILEPVMGPQSVLLLDEAEHHRIRQLLTPAFHGEALRGYRTTITELAVREVENWPIRRPISLQPLMQRLTLEIILRVVLGVTEPSQQAQLRPLIGRIVSLDPLTMLGWFYPRLRGIWPWKGFGQLQRALDDAIYELIRQRRARPSDGSGDVLSRLLTTSADIGSEVGAAVGPLTDAELRDNLITLLLAGHETTATGLSWAGLELARHPAAQRTAAAAAREGTEAYLLATFREALRLHPVIYEVIRRVREPVEIGGYQVRAGASVVPAIGVVQADRRYHQDPYLFDPARFAGSPATSTWIPFGGGIRRCLGAGFAELEATVVLGELLSRYELLPADRRPERPHPRNITLAPRHGGRVVLERRVG